MLRLLRTIRAKHACRACESPVVQAPAPARLIENRMASTALVAHIAVAKYGWLSTLYRQTQILAGQGVILDRQTLARWMKQAAWMLKGLYELQLSAMHRRSKHHRGMTMDFYGATSPQPSTLDRRVCWFHSPSFPRATTYTSSSPPRVCEIYSIRP